MHIAAWHLLQHAQVKLRSIRFEEQHVALPGCRKQSGIPLQNSKWLNVSNGQSQIDLIWYSICNISLYISIIFIFVFIYCLYICSNMTDALCWWWMLVPANVNVNSSTVGPGLLDTTRRVFNKSNFGNPHGKHSMKLYETRHLTKLFLG